MTSFPCFFKSGARGQLCPPPLLHTLLSQQTILPSYWGFPNTSIFNIVPDLALQTSSGGHEGRDWFTNRLQPFCSELENQSAKTWATPGTSKLWMGMAALPCLEGSWPLALTLGLRFQCHLSCSAMQTPMCLSGSSWAQHHTPARVATMLCCAGAYRNCCSVSNSAHPQCPALSQC